MAARTRPGSSRSGRPFAAKGPASTSTSWRTRARRASTTPTRRPPTPGSPRSSASTTRRTSSGSTRTSCRAPDVAPAGHCGVAVPRPAGTRSNEDSAPQRRGAESSSFPTASRFCYCIRRRSGAALSRWQEFAGKEVAMHARVSRYRAKDEAENVAERVRARVEQEFYPRYLVNAPGFRGYFVVDLGDQDGGHELV